MGFQHTAALRPVMAEHYAPAAANHRLSALRGVLKAAWNLGQIPSKEYHRAHARARGIAPGRTLAPRELRMLFLTCADDGSATGALLAILYGIGLRCSEAVALDYGDYDLESGALTVRSARERLLATFSIPVPILAQCK